MRLKHWQRGEDMIETLSLLLRNEEYLYSMNTSFVEKQRAEQVK